MGSWICYGLGNESRSLPAYMVMPDPDGALEAGQPMYMNGFLPSVYQPTMLRPGKQPVRNLALPKGVNAKDRRKTVDLIRRLNEAGLRRGDDELEARIAAYELAFRMQTEAHRRSIFRRNRKKRINCTVSEPNRPTITDDGVCWPGGSSSAACDSSQSSQAADRETNSGMPTKTLKKTTCGWRPRSTGRFTAVDRLETTRSARRDAHLVGGEFGRSPDGQGGIGRDHHNLGFTMWLAGGGIRGGQTIGETDAIGLKAVDKPYHLRDIHTTILHQLGLDQDELSFLHQGRRERLTLVHGKVIKEAVR